MSPLDNESLGHLQLLGRFVRTHGRLRAVSGTAGEKGSTTGWCSLHRDGRPILQRADGQPLPDTDFQALAEELAGAALSPTRSSTVFVLFERFLQVGLERGGGTAGFCQQQHDAEPPGSGLQMMSVAQTHTQFSMTHAVAGAHEIIAAAKLYSVRGHLSSMFALPFLVCFTAAVCVSTTGLPCVFHCLSLRAFAAFPCVCSLPFLVPSPLPWQCLRRRAAADGRPRTGIAPGRSL